MLRPCMRPVRPRIAMLSPPRDMLRPLGSMLSPLWSMLSPLRSMLSPLRSMLRSLLAKLRSPAGVIGWLIAALRPPTRAVRQPIAMRGPRERSIRAPTEGVRPPARSCEAPLRPRATAQGAGFATIGPTEARSASPSTRDRAGGGTRSWVDRPRPSSRPRTRVPSGRSTATAQLAPANAHVTPACTERLRRHGERVSDAPDRTDTFLREVAERLAVDVSLSALGADADSSVAGSVLVGSRLLYVPKTTSHKGELMPKNASWS
jgi:hypothetical protein